MPQFDLRTSLMGLASPVKADLTRPVREGFSTLPDVRRDNSVLDKGVYSPGLGGWYVGCMMLFSCGILVLLVLQWMIFSQHNRKKHPPTITAAAKNNDKNTKNRGFNSKLFHFLKKSFSATPSVSCEGSIIKSKVIKETKKTGFVSLRNLRAQVVQDKIKLKQEQRQKKQAVKKAPEPTKVKPVKEKKILVGKPITVLPHTNSHSDKKATTNPCSKAPMSLFYRTKNKLLNDAEFLLNFSYLQEGIVEQETSQFVNKIKTLTFLFAYHRYNLARYILSTDKAEKQELSDLRCLIVHLAIFAPLTPEVITKTQQEMKNFVVRDVSRSIQEKSLTSMRSNPRIQNLIELGAKGRDYFTLYSVQSLALSQVFLQQKKLLESEQFNPQNVSNLDLIIWVMNDILPLIVKISTLENNEILNAKERKYAIKMLFIIMGEYCDKGRILRLTKESYRPDYIDFFKESRLIRNKLSHKVSSSDATPKCNLNLKVWVENAKALHQLEENYTQECKSNFDMLDTTTQQDDTFDGLAENHSYCRA